MAWAALVGRASGGEDPLLPGLSVESSCSGAATRGGSRQPPFAPLTPDVSSRRGWSPAVGGVGGGSLRNVGRGSMAGRGERGKAGATEGLVVAATMAGRRLGLGGGLAVEAAVVDTLAIIVVIAVRRRLSLLSFFVLVLGRWWGIVDGRWGNMGPGNQCNHRRGRGEGRT